MFRSKELGDCNPWTQCSAPTSTNAGYAHGCHHMSLLVLALRRRHTICDLVRETCSPTEDHSRSSYTQSKLNTLTQLSVHLQGRHRTSVDLQPYIPHICSHSHLPSHPMITPSTRQIQPYVTQHSRTCKQPDRHCRITAFSSILSSSSRLRDTPSSFIVVTGGEVL